MRVFSTIVAACTLAVTVTAVKVVPIGISRPIHKLPPIHKRAQTWTQELQNNLTGGGYHAEVEVGTPGQKVSLVIDTGSSDVWVIDSNADLCIDPDMQEVYGGGCIATYDPSDSSTYEIIDDGEDVFSIQYVDGSGAQGDYFQDTIAIGGTKIKSLQMGLATNTTINSGLLGIGFAANVAAKTPYSTIIDLLVEQGLIGLKAYSLYLNDLQSSTGTVLFGGIDTEKYIGDLQSVDIGEDSRSGTYSSFTVALSSLVGSQDGRSTEFFRSHPEALPVVLDSGTTLSYFPSMVTDKIYDAFNAVDDTSDSGLVYINCSYLNANITFDFQFGSSDGPVIRVPVDEMVLDNIPAYIDLGYLNKSELPFDNACSFGIQPNTGIYLLGDTFLRSAYVVYDLDNLKIALAQANVNATESNVIEIEAGGNIPNATGVVSHIEATATATGLPGTGNGSGNGSALPTVTVTSSAGASNTSNTGTRAVPAPDWQALGVAVVAGFSAMVGGLIIVL
ncbi:aspartic peptidase domain-containing protein [Pseudomassariella vexata]|uniref:Aspartic peptidase domain-containing protein n=1 Tax=Pseudomassariella vexata TaxID=1141098 RepID=A0A1Y2D7N4_9PEZI|nr:aspartic peptidase domain-containing protein [Pseudomassariella vexata]ORY55283.1 aspartic peptidase domain-containing protein [Pseudomassariella vexata]